MKILGIDPGTATTGFGVIETTPNGYLLLDYGLVSTDKNKPMASAWTSSIKAFPGLSPSTRQKL